MLSYLVLTLFLLGLMMTIFFDLSLIVALVFGYIVFFAYAVYLHNSPAEILMLSWDGIKTVKNILLTFIFIGALTATWRASGTIAFIIFYATSIIVPQIFLLLTFWLCSLISVLTGTAFGTAATMGVICMTMGVALNVNPIFIGGAVLSGVFVGDRCSPMSTSALLTAALTETEIFKNIPVLFKTSIVPFIISSLLYLGAGIMTKSEQIEIQMLSLFAQVFNLHPITLLPAIVIVIMSMCKIEVKKTMLISIISALGVCSFAQNVSPVVLVDTILVGYKCSNQTLGQVINGGGILSMVNIFCIVCLSSTYAKIFAKTGLLLNIQAAVDKLSHRITNFGCVMVTSVLTSMFSCNQSFAIILTSQLCEKLYRNKYKFAIVLGNTVVVIAALIPWNISARVPLVSIGASNMSIVAAFYLYLLPIYCCVKENIGKSHNSKNTWKIS